MLAFPIIILSTVFQLATAFLAIRLIRITGKQLSWILIAAAMTLQASRRIYILSTLISGEVVYNQVSTSEGIGLIVSVLMFTGVMAIGSFLNKSQKGFAEHEKSAEALPESEDKYRFMFSNNPQPMWIYDLETLSFLEVNDAAINHYGYSREEFLAMTLKDIRPEEDIEALLKDVELTRKTYNPAGEWRHLKKNGELLNVEIISHTITFKNRKARHVMVTDITERKRDELLLHERNQKIVSQFEEYVIVNEELKSTNEELIKAKEVAEESEKKYKLLFDFNPMPMSIFDAQTLEFLSVNESFCDKYGYSREEFLNMTILEIRPDTEIEKLKQSVSLTDKGVTNVGIFLHKKKNGEIIQVEIIRHELMFDDRNAKLVLINDVTDKLKAEAVIRETQLKLKEAYKLAHIGIWEWEIATDTVIWTEELYHIAGLDPLLPAPSYKEQAKLFAPVSWKILNKLVEKTLKTREPYQSELELIRPDGDIRYVNAFGGAKQDANGQIIGLFGTLQDITELKQAQEALREREYLLSASQRAAHIGTWSWKVGEATVYWSDETYRIYGLNPEMGPPSYEFFFTIIHPEDRAKMQEWPTAILAGSHPPPVEFRVLRPDGIYRLIQTDGDVIDYVGGVPSRIAGTAYDITERKKDEEKLKENYNLLRIAGEKAKLGGWNVILSENKSYWSDEVAAIHEMPAGYSPLVEEGINFYAPEWRDKITEVFSRCVKEGITYDEEMEIISSSGKRIWVRTIGEAVRDDNGKIFKIQGAFQDITERKKAEENILQLNNELEQRVSERTARLEATNKELEAFSYSVSHDLRSPLRHINGFAEILARQYSDLLPEDARKHLDTITGSAKRMGVLIDDLLSFSRTGRVEMKKTTVSVRQIVDDVLSQCRPSLTDRIVKWEIAPLPEVKGDYNLLRLSWVNLIDNALKYSKTREKTVISIGYKEEANETVFYIQDNGVGFDMKYADKLFGVFQRLHSSSQFEGTGIGLANVQRIILRHGGRTWAEAEPDKGATFYFSIPK